MQRCLAVEELVRTIVHYAAVEDDQASLLGVALVSHIFYEPAMDELWRSLTGIDPLILCLPPVKISTKSTLRKAIITSPPLGKEWTRFDHHARRVEVLTLRRAEYLPLEAAEIASLDIVRDHCPGPVLPRLRSLTLASGLYLPRQVEMFMGESLVAFDLATAHSAADFLAFLDSCQQQSPRLSRLRFAHPRGLSDATTVEWHVGLASVLCAFKHLKSIGGAYWSYHTLPVEAIVHISHLPGFDELTLVITDLNIAVCRSASLGSFASITVLNLHFKATTTVPSDWAHLFRSLACADLQDLLVSIDYTPPTDAPTPSSELVPWLATLGRFRNLRSCRLALEVHDRRSGIWTDTTGVWRGALDPAVLRPLYHAHDMHELALRALPIKLTAPACEEMAKAWPRLAHLKLHCALDVPPAERLPLGDLAHLAGCPRLALIEVAVAPVPADWSWQAPAHGVAPSEARRLAFTRDFHLVQSAHTAPKVAAFLDAYFPRTEAQCEWGSIDGALVAGERQQRRDAFEMVLQSRSDDWEMEERI